MRTARWVLAFLAVSIGGMAQESSSAVPSTEGFAVVCPLSGMIDDGNMVFVQRAVRETRGAQALVFVIDTPGGKVDSAIEITKAIVAAPCKTIAYVTGMGAISAGALISMACDEIIMAPGSAIGAATPVIMGPEGMEPTGEKEVSFMRAKMRALAEQKGHNPAIAEAMVDKDIELRAIVRDGKTVVYRANPQAAQEKPTSTQVTETVNTILDALREATGTPIPKVTPPPEPAPPIEAVPPAGADGSQLVLPAGKLLTLTPSEAQQYGLIQTTAKSLDEVVSFYGMPNIHRRALEMTWAEKIFRFLTNPMVSGILLMLGIGGIYLEIKTPGFGMPGIIGIVCLALFFGAYAVIGLADWIDVLLVAVGVGLIIVEIFFIPGFGFVGAGGIVCLVLGVYLALTKVAFPEYQWDYDRLRDAGISAVMASVTFTLLVYLSWKILPKTPLYGSLVLSMRQMAAKGYTVQTEADHTGAIGLRGVATSKLRPAGRGRFGDSTYDVVSRGEFIESGTPIVIVQVSGNRYVVDKIEGAT